jgi:group I intron endonuclease
MVDNSKKRVRTTAFIYKISRDNAPRGECYVGSTTMTLEERFRLHTNTLKRNDHSSPEFQKSWNEFEGVGFKIRFLEECKVRDRFVREQFYIDTLSPRYNVHMTVHPGLTPEVQDKISQTMREHWINNPLPTEAQKEVWKGNAAVARESSPANKSGWVPHHRIGTKHSDETLAKMSDARNRVIAEKKASGEFVEIGKRISASKKAQNRGTRAKAVLAVMSGEWETTQQIADKCPFGRDNAYLALKQLEKEGKVVMGIASPRLALWKPT